MYFVCPWGEVLLCERRRCNLLLFTLTAVSECELNEQQISVHESYAPEVGCVRYVCVFGAEPHRCIKNAQLEQVGQKGS